MQRDPEPDTASRKQLEADPRSAFTASTGELRQFFGTLQGLEF